MDAQDQKTMLESQLVNTLIAENKSARRWKNFRFIVWVLFVLFFAYLLVRPDSDTAGPVPHAPYVSLVRLDGVIMPDSLFSAQTVIPQLNRAFKDKHSKGVVLLINSPGGSPVQASIIHDKIIQLKNKYHKTVIVVGEDTLASGAYLVATAADKIFVNKDTVTGSIGVIMSGFGFADAIKKLGITRRVFTAGDSKDRLDPFEALNPQDIAKAQQVLAAVHQDFIDDVTTGRAGKLTGDPKTLFSGDFWTGTQATQLGLVDGTANIWTAMQDTFGTTHYRDYSPMPPIWEAVMHNVSSELNFKLENHRKVEEII
ncbi:MAG: peptidase U7 [Gammaproteobacteria bacterium RIFCSPHIGHO2_12_FULL_38_11]|nr:MAG: peptidase U7 [Gammaproteobacteria bacterium RIFCSPHIGHO2_12_FULL_38_11]